MEISELSYSTFYFKAFKTPDKVTDNLPYLSDHICEKTPLHANANRFLINLYEKPLSASSEKKDRCSFNALTSNRKKHRLWTVGCKYDKDKTFRKNSDNYPSKSTMDRFADLRCRRDIECIKIKEASNVLQYLSSISQDGYWFERLLAEKMLLESGVAARILRSKISEEYVYVKNRDIQIGTIAASNFKFYLNKFHTKHNETEFFVLLLSSGTDVKSSKVARCTNGEITFDEEFVFPVTLNFSVKVQIYSTVMKEASKMALLNKFLPSKVTMERNRSKIQFKNLNTSNFEEVQIQKTSFKLGAEAAINVTNLHSKSWKLKQNSRMDDCASFSVTMKSFKIENKRAGFLTTGYKFNDTIVWNRCWCIIDNHHLNLYKYPSDEDPQISLDLINCPSREIEEAPRILCNRPRSFVVEIRESETVNKHFFMADNCEELEEWLTDLNLVLELLRSKIAYKL